MESAIVLPLAVFIVLGLLQMGMMQQARLFADYAAYRGARAASLEMGECQPVVQAELAALVPALGRADTAANWVATYTEATGGTSGTEGQKSSLGPLVMNFWTIESPTFLTDHSIDTPVTNEQDISHIHLKMYFLYELRIPFANWVIARAYLAQYAIAGASYANDVNPLTPVGKAGQLLSPRSASGWEAQQVTQAAKAYFDAGRYVVPLYASWSMRMFTPPDPANLNLDSGSSYCR